MRPAYGAKLEGELMKLPAAHRPGYLRRHVRPELVQAFVAWLVEEGRADQVFPDQRPRHARPDGEKRRGRA